MKIRPTTMVSALISSTVSPIPCWRYWLPASAFGTQWRHGRREKNAVPLQNVFSGSSCQECTQKGHLRLPQTRLCVWNRSHIGKRIHTPSSLRSHHNDKTPLGDATHICQRKRKVECLIDPTGKHCRFTHDQSSCRISLSLDNSNAYSNIISGRECLKDKECLNVRHARDKLQQRVTRHWTRTGRPAFYRRNVRLYASNNDAPTSCNDTFVTTKETLAYRTDRRRKIFRHNILSELEGSRTSEQIEAAVEGLLERRSDGTSSLSSRDRTDIIRHLGNLGAYSSMLKLIRNSTFHPSVHSYTAAIATLATSGDAAWRPTAIGLLDEMVMKGLQPNTYTFTAAFLAIDGGAESMDVLNRMWKDYGVHPDVHVYNAAMHACSRGAPKYEKLDQSEIVLPTASKTGFELALMIFNRMRKEEIAPTEKSYESLLHCCSKSKEARMAVKLLGEMRRLNMQPSSRAYGAALAACASTRNYIEALHVFRLVEADGKHDLRIGPNTMHYNALLSALAKGGKDKMAMSIFEGMLVAARRRQNKSQSPRKNPIGNMMPRAAVPDIVTLNTVLTACAKAKNYVDARRLLDRAKGGEFTMITSSSPRRHRHHRAPVRPDTISYNSVLSACSDPRVALALLQEMRDSRRGRHGRVVPTAVSYTNALSVCHRAGDLETAKELISIARKDGMSPNVYMYSTYIWTAAECGDCHEALEVLATMRAEGCEPNVVTYNGVISACAARGEWQEALNTYGRMKADGIAPSQVTFKKMAASMMTGCPAEERISVLEKIVHGMNPRELQILGPPLLDALILSYGSVGRWKKAMGTFELITSPTSTCFSSILSVCATGPTARCQEAKELVGKMEAADISIDATALGYAVMACAKGNQWQDALDLIAKHGLHRRKGAHAAAAVPVAALNSVIASCGRNHRPDVAVAILNEMKFVYNVAPNERSYRSAIMACNRAEHENARQYKMRLKESPSYHRGRRRTPHNAAVGVGDDGDLTFHGDDDDEKTFFSMEWWECALSLIRRMREDGMTPDIRTYSSAISACEAAGKWQRALGLLKLMEEGGDGGGGEVEPNFVCLSAAISACEKGGAWVEALELFERMKKREDCSPNFVTVNSVLIALDRAGQRELAETLYIEAVEEGIVTPWKEAPPPSLVKSSIGNNEETPVRMLDLHQFSVAMAKIAVRSVLESLLGPSPLHDADRDLIIISGRGNRSEGGQPMIMPVILDMIWHEFEIVAKVQERNRGRIIVPSHELIEFASRRCWY